MTDSSLGLSTFYGGDLNFFNGVRKNTLATSAIQIVLLLEISTNNMCGASGKTGIASNINYGIVDPKCAAIGGSISTTFPYHILLQVYFNINLFQTYTSVQTLKGVKLSGGFWGSSYASNCDATGSVYNAICNNYNHGLPLVSTVANTTDQQSLRRYNYIADIASTTDASGVALARYGIAYVACVGRYVANYTGCG